MKSWFLRERDMSNSGFKIRSMKREEMNLAVEWAAAEGWNPGLDDAEPFYVADPDGYLLGLMDEEPIAMISAVKYGNTFGFMGFYIVKPEWRGHGYGQKIWNAAVASLEGRNVGLDGVVDQQDNYRKSGFSLAHRNIRYQLDTPVAEPSIDDVTLVPLDMVATDLLARYDRAFFAEDRCSFLRGWIAQPHSAGVALMCGDDLAGYGVIRQCHNGYKIGPLFADSKVFAEALFRALCNKVTGPIFLDVPECNSQAVALVEEYGMQRVFETARMYTKKAPDISLERTYGITSFELG